MHSRHGTLCLSLAAEEDRRERRRKLGLPEDLSEAEKEEERKKAAVGGRADSLFCRYCSYDGIRLLSP